VVAPDGERPPSIGFPISGAVAEVVDESLCPVAPGVDGELLIGGVAVALGYLNREELTDERFVETPQGRRYRTGDRVRQLPNGEIEFLGRTDDQLSIRGFRIEPGEVATVLNSHPAVDASVAVGVGSRSGDRQLVAYVSSATGEQPDPRELAAFLGRSLPEHMVPSMFIWLDELPMTRHGKIDRAALPAPVETARDAHDAEQRDATPMEVEIASLAAELLEVGSIGMEDNIFLLGGHSMLGAQLIARLEERFGVEVSLRYLFDHPTPAAITVEVARQMPALEAVE
jgi:acyl-coenzyme A synthetase/AMP-(fatty) acid ligase/acyl carrier protein